MPSLRELYGLRITLSPLDVFTYETHTLHSIVHNESNVAFLYLKTSLFSRVGFTRFSLFSVNDRLRVFADLTVERSGSLNSTLEISYTSREFGNKKTWFDFNGFRMYPAAALYDYDVIDVQKALFQPGQKVSIQKHSIL